MTREPLLQRDKACFVAEPSPARARRSRVSASRSWVIRVRLDVVPRDGFFDMAVSGGHPWPSSSRPRIFCPCSAASTRPPGAWHPRRRGHDAARSPEDPDRDGRAGIPGRARQHPDRRRRHTRRPWSSPGTLADFASPTFTVRATERTVGPSGKQAMPAELPPGTGYTYAVDLTIDEAEAAGLARVSFNQPVPVYVDNFTGFPSGHRGSGGALRPRQGGVDRLCERRRPHHPLDHRRYRAPRRERRRRRGYGRCAHRPRDPGGEQQLLAGLYAGQSGKSLWRVAVQHFSSWDLNLGDAAGQRARSPDRTPPKPPKPKPKPRDVCGGSILECENQILRESVPVVGTPYSLRHSAKRSEPRARGADQHPAQRRDGAAGDRAAHRRDRGGRRSAVEGELRPHAGQLRLRVGQDRRVGSSRRATRPSRSRSATRTRACTGRATGGRSRAGGALGQPGDQRGGGVVDDPTSSSRTSTRRRKGSAASSSPRTTSSIRRRGPFTGRRDASLRGRRAPRGDDRGGGALPVSGVPTASGAWR